jgi:diaminopimelate dehydrogenase
MSRIRVAIVGYGNVGRGAVQAVTEEPDMELVGVIRRKGSAEGVQPIELSRTRTASDIRDLGEVDVAILCGPTRSIIETACEILKLGVNTVDSFDIHQQIPQLRRDLGDIARTHQAVAITSAGWDPGIDSVIRAWFVAMAPKGITYTNYGPGMSMGHTAAVKGITGVRNALSITVPTGIGVHQRMVYVELEENADSKEVEQNIKQDPYFAKDTTYVFQVDNVESLVDVGHGVLMERSGVSGITHNQMLRFQIRVNNPALTSQVMVSAARASMKQKPGCYTMIEVPVIDFLRGDVASLVSGLV